MVMKKNLSFLLLVLLLALALTLVSCDIFGIGVAPETPGTTPETPGTTPDTPNDTPDNPLVDNHKHSYSKVVTDPTCTEQGYTTYTCDCDDSYVDNYVDAMGHNFGEWLTVKEPTTVEEGLEERTCACGETESNTLPKIAYSSEGLEFTLNDDGESYSVTGIGVCTDVDIVIPDTYQNLPVTSIGRNAFQNCTSITSITIPNSVTDILWYAFDGCTSIKDVYYMGGIEDWLSISSFMRIGAQPLEYGANLYFNNNLVTEIEIPDSFTSIPDGAFAGCTSLTSVIIPETVTVIEDLAFSRCTSLTNIIIPNSVTDIGGGAFSGCTSLISVTIGNSVKKTDVGVFAMCTSLTSICFNGTVEQWDAISFGGGWRLNVPATEVICSDGTVTLE